jgi:hypothetical protein
VGGVGFHPTAARPASRREAAWDWLQAQLAGRPVPAVLTIVGLGDGSLLDALDAYSPGTKVLAIEPDSARAALKYPALDRWRRMGRLVHLVAPEYAGADQGWRVFPTRFEEPPLLIHPSSARSPDLRAAVVLLRKIVFGARANAEARRRFAPRYLLNSIRNLPAILDGRDIRELTERAKGVPAIVVGAGPSLDRSLDDLQRLSSRAVIFATDTALRPLLARGIAPQFVVALDPSEINGRHLLALPSCPNTCLVAESALDPRAAAAFHGRTLWFRVAPHQPWPWLNTLGLDVGRLEVWGSVLTAGFQVAALAGCDPIIMVGADLSFPDGRPYARGTTYEFDWAWAAAHGTPVEETWQNLLAGRKDLRVERDLIGIETPTSAVMIEFRDWIVAQGKKGARRLINCTGRGLLVGDGVEQAALSDVLEECSPLPRVDLPERRSTPNPATFAQALRAVTSALASGARHGEPLASWEEFSGEGFDAGRLAAAVVDASQRLDAPSSSGCHEAASTSLTAGGAIMMRLPEAASRLRTALAGSALPAAPTSRAERTARLVTALDGLGRIVRDVGQCPKLVSLPEPSLVGKVAAAGIVMWPETIRRAAFEFEALLSDAWGDAVVPPVSHAFANGRVLLPESVAATPSAVPATHLYAPHGCVLLALEWLACASSLADGRALRGAAERLWALQELLQRAVLAPLPTAPPAELILQATSGRTVEVVLPLGVAEPALARVLTGAMRIGGDDAWELGAATIGAVTVRVVVRQSSSRRLVPPARIIAPQVPRRLVPEAARKLKVAEQIPDGVLCVVDFGTETVLVRADGSVSPYQSWPRSITGAASLGDRGDAAWSNVLNPQRGVTPYLMYRPSADADVVTIPLDFRPARGLWWRDRLYFTCNPGPQGHAGLASWAPGQPPSLLVRDVPLQGLVPRGESLWLEPFVPGPSETVARRHAESGWCWRPGGGEPTPRTLGRLGASSGSASIRDWIALSYPQADVVTLERKDGRRLELRCYNPLRIGWAGSTLVVFAGDGELLLFEQLLDAIEV